MPEGVAAKGRISAHSGNQHVNHPESKSLVDVADDTRREGRSTTRCLGILGFRREGAVPKTVFWEGEGRAKIDPFFWCGEVEESDLKVAVTLGSEHIPRTMQAHVRKPTLVQLVVKLGCCV